MANIVHINIHYELDEEHIKSIKNIPPAKSKNIGVSLVGKFGVLEENL